MRRRDFIGMLGGAAAWPLATRAQQLNKVPRIGVLWNGKSAETHPYFQSLRNEFKRIGYAEGTLIFEDRFYDENAEIVDLLAKQLVDARCDVLVGVTAAAALALRRATSTVPIVFVFNSNPVGSGLVASLNHPGGNVTGITHIGHEQAAKRVQLLKDTIPGLASVALIWDSTPTNLFQNRVEVEETRTAANQFGLSFESFECGSPEIVEEAISKASRYGAAILGNSSWYIFARERFAELAIARRLAIISSADVYSDSGFLMSYGANWAAVVRGGAPLVKKILEGQKPENIPVEEPTVFDLVFNLKTAEALGLEIPPIMLARRRELLSELEITCSPSLVGTGLLLSAFASPGDDAAAHRSYRRQGLPWVRRPHRPLSHLPAGLTAHRNRTALLDDFVRHGEQCFRKRKSESLGCPNIENQVEFIRLLNRKPSRALTFKNAVDV